MEIKIHRGTHEIGGSCVILKCQSKMIILDIGMPLNQGNNIFLPDEINDPNLLGVFISHPHGDHYGLLESVSERVPVFIGELALEMVHAARVFTDKKKLQVNSRFLNAGEKIKLGPFVIVPYLNDHSCVDAFGFWITSDGDRKSVFYSGDFRGHGKRAKAFEYLLRHPDGELDALILEGTMIGRDKGEFRNESDVEKKFIETLDSNINSPVILVSSGQNSDRLAVAYRSCLQTHRVLVVDIYTAWVMRKISSKFPKFPDLSWDNIRVLCRGSIAARQYGVVKRMPEYFNCFTNEIYKPNNQITIEEIAKNPGQYLLKTNQLEQILDCIDYETAIILYSQWLGYIDKNRNSKLAERYEKLTSDGRTRVVYAHCTGHAYIEDLQKLAEALNPRVIIPIHTELPNEFREIFSNKEVIVLQDHDVYNL